MANPEIEESACDCANKTENVASNRDDAKGGICWEVPPVSPGWWRAA